MLQIRNRHHRALAMLASMVCLIACLSPTVTQAQEEAERLALLAYLGLDAADGTTEVKADAGKLEAALLMAPTLEEAAAKLFTIPAVTSSTKIIPLVGSMKLDLRALAITEMRLTTIENAERLVIDCSTLTETSVGVAAQVEGSGDSGTKLDDSTQALLSSAVALLKTDTTYSAIALSANDQMVLNALVARGGNRIFLPEDRVFLKGNPFDTRLVLSVAKLEAKKGKCAAKAKSKDEAVSAVAKEQLAAIERAMVLANSLTALGEKGAPSLIEQAGVLQMNADAQNSLRILRVDIGAIGGTMVQRKNVFTALGIDGGISIRGGVAMSWRLINPTSGMAEAGGTVICASPVAGFQNVYQRAQESVAANCWVSGSK